MTSKAQDGVFGTVAVGFGLTAVLVLGLGGWAAASSIAGAVVAPGQVQVASGVRTIQHREGGILAEVLVKNGDRVRKGMLLARLEGVAPRANLAIVESQALQLRARQARLEAERDGRSGIEIPPDAERRAWAALMLGEQQLMGARQAARAQRKGQLTEQARQAEQEIVGLEAQAASLVTQRELLDGELAGMRQLYEKGLAPLARVNALERELARITGQSGDLAAAVARARSRIAERRLQALQVDSEFRAEVGAELKEAVAKLAELDQQRVAQADEVRRVEIRAPAGGTIHQLGPQTVGGVVAPGDTLMLIVPDHDALVVDARIDPGHVDQVRRGAPARIRFTSFSVATTPEIPAQVDRLSADVQTDPRTGETFYTARLALDQRSLPSRLRNGLTPGMPAEVQIVTGSRPAISYFVKPLADQLQRTFREE